MNRICFINPTTELIQDKASFYVRSSKDSTLKTVSEHEALKLYLKSSSFGHGISPDKIFKDSVKLVDGKYKRDLIKLEYESSAGKFSLTHNTVTSSISVKRSDYNRIKL